MSPSHAQKSAFASNNLTLIPPPPPPSPPLPKKKNPQPVQVVTECVQRTRDAIRFCTMISSTVIRPHHNFNTVTNSTDRFCKNWTIHCCQDYCRLSRLRSAPLTSAPALWRHVACTCMQFIWTWSFFCAAWSVQSDWMQGLLTVGTLYNNHNRTAT